MQLLKVISFPATNINLVERFILGHRNALNERGTQSITSNNMKWFNKEGVYCIMIIDKNNELIGGVRIEKLNKDRKVPIQYISNRLTKRINSYINKFSTGELIAELCALWIHPQYRTNHLATEIGKFAISKSHTLNINNLFLIERLSQSISDRIGFSRSNKLMHQDEYFLYPTPRYKSVIAEIIDLKRYLNFDFYRNNDESLKLKECYKQINAYILNPMGKIIVDSGGSTFEIYYDLSK